MAEANGFHREPTPFEAIVAWLPYLSDAERGKLRSLLMAPRMISRRAGDPKDDGKNELKSVKGRTE